MILHRCFQIVSKNNIIYPFCLLNRSFSSVPSDIISNNLRKGFNQATINLKKESLLNYNDKQSMVMDHLEPMENTIRIEQEVHAALNDPFHQDLSAFAPKIVVVGVGGAGGNAVNNMISRDLTDVEFLVCNTDAQHLKTILTQNKIQMGSELTGGLGCGANPNMGRQAAEFDIDQIFKRIEGANMIFITAGMGGGTGTGAAPVIAKKAKESGMLTVAVVTKPFHFEGVHRAKLAEAGLNELKQSVDTMIVIPNQNLFNMSDDGTTFMNAFRVADDVLFSGVKNITDLMVTPGLINLDFADVQSVMSGMGIAMMGSGEAEGEDRALKAAEAALHNPILGDISVQGAKGMLLNIVGGEDMTLFEVDAAAKRVTKEVEDPLANIIFGSTYDKNMEGKVRVSVVATGITDHDR